MISDCIGVGVQEGGWFFGDVICLKDNISCTSTPSFDLLALSIARKNLAG